MMLYINILPYAPNAIQSNDGDLLAPELLNNRNVAPVVDVEITATEHEPKFDAIDPVPVRNPTTTFGAVEYVVPNVTLLSLVLPPAVDENVADPACI